MVKKLFALASVTALTGLMAAVATSGCSSSTVVDGSPASEAGADAKVNPKDSSTPPDTDDAAVDSGGTGTCPSTDKVDTSTVPFKTPTPSIVGACVDSDFIAMEKVVTDAVKSGMTATLTYEKILAGTSTACQACAIQPASNATWSPIVKGADVGGGKTDDISNPGACFALASGVDACGKAYGELDACINEVCQDCASTARGACNTAATKAKTGPCLPQLTALQTSCGAKLQSTAKACDDANAAACTTCSGTFPAKGNPQYVFEGPIGQQCGKGAVVAGGG